MRDNCNLTYNQILKLILLKAHPVHSYFQIADSSFDPNIEFGGTWILLPEGTILMSGKTDRSGNDNKLTKENIPSFTTDISGSHNHTISIPVYSTSGNIGKGLDQNGAYYGDVTFTSTDSAHSHTYTNNKQKDLFSVIKSPIVYTWYRTN